MKSIVPIAFAAVLGLLAAGCDSGLTNASENLPPNTTLANIPLEGDTLFSLVTLHWNGGDPDGFVAAYEYRFVSYPLQRGDSVVQDWTRTRETSVTVAFSSPDPLNRQVFQVRSIDNNGVTDPEPAVKSFYTTQSFVPIAEILSPAGGESLFVTEQTSDWWQGIPLSFTARDPDGEVEAYAWSVDDGDWVWTTDTTLFIPPSAFRGGLEGTHTIRVTARDNTDLVNPEGDVIEITLVRPTFDRDRLIIDETNERNFPSRAGITDADVDAFYADVFGLGDAGAWDEWDYASQGMPPPEVLGRYRTVIWHADDRPTSAPHSLANQEEAIKDYLNVGGNIIMSGWRVLKSFAWQENFPQRFDEGTFVNDYMQIGTVDETPLLGDFVGTAGLSGFTDLRIDSTKLSGVTPTPTLNYVNVIETRGGFTEPVGAYQAPSQARMPQYRGKTVGLIYHGTSFNAAVLGFPLYFMRQEDARVFAGQVVERVAR